MNHNLKLSQEDNELFVKLFYEISHHIIHDEWYPNLMMYAKFEPENFNSKINDYIDTFIGNATVQISILNKLESELKTFFKKQSESVNSKTLVIE